MVGTISLNYQHAQFMTFALGKHVVFGKVVRGEDVVQKLAIVPVDGKDRPQVPVEIINCGELELRRKPEESATGELHFEILMFFALTTLPQLSPRGTYAAGQMMSAKHDGDENIALTARPKIHHEGSGRSLNGGNPDL